MKFPSIGTLFPFFFLPSAQAITWTAAPFNPPSIPLAVRTPYLSAWLPQGPGAALNDVWPTFWTGSILGWAGFVKVDGKAYSFLGAPNVPSATFTKAVQKSFQFTSTQSIFVLSAGPVDLTVTFLSPVEATDLVKQSIPFAYLAVSAASMDGAAHSVQVYSDISAEWVSGNNALIANWSTTTGSILTHQVQLQTQSVFSELNDHIQHGSAFYSTSNIPGVTYQTGGDIAVRAQFINNGRLPNTRDTNFRAIQDNWPVFAFAHDLDMVTGATTPVVVSVGHVRDPAIRYVVAGGGTQSRSVYFWSQFSTPAALISSFLSDFDNSLARAKAFDNKVNLDSSKISIDYAAIVALSLRQALATIEITITKNNDGTWNTGDVLVFMKEISSNGNMNTVDVIFPAWPGLLYTNPLLGKYLLEALFRYQATGLYPNKWSIHDLGASYPQALGHNDGNDEAMPVEESGNMLIMALSYAQRTGDTSHIIQYNKLLDQWTQFLITDSLIPANQLSTDDFAGHLANQTNLAIKGIIGIKAMSQIAQILGDPAKGANYSSIAADYVTRWQKLAASSTGQHLTLSYGDSSSWGLVYNLYAEKLLNFSIFPSSIYTMQTAWYKTVAQPFGIPLDTRHTYTKTDWEIYTAAIVTDNAARDLFIGSVKKYASSGVSSQPFGDWYETTDGRAQGFRARPVAGGHLGKVSWAIRCLSFLITSVDELSDSLLGSVNLQSMLLKPLEVLTLPL
ncbi:Glutaminase A [Hypsizygus marmoreus]|uniref:Glutaminase A n=1 Tax=Hypsizygus marmoreus TaxID=39966 RepID=A0A369JL61_HYPMA|nr:Glutaminase A [Hypsizygus marmoreus]